MTEVRIGEAKVLIDENHRILSVEPINETFGTRLDESNSYTLEQLANSREFPFLNKLARRTLEKLKEDEESEVEEVEEIEEPEKTKSIVIVQTKKTPGLPYDYSFMLRRKLLEKQRKNRLLIFILTTILIIVLVFAIINLNKQPPFRLTQLWNSH